MRCFNCRKEIPDDAVQCEFCEATVEPAPTEEEFRAVQEIMDQMDPGLLGALQDLAGRSATAEEFADRIMVGDCPKCGSEETGNCENDPDVDCIIAGRCFACGQLWCTDCGRLLKKEDPACPCWDEED